MRAIAAQMKGVVTVYVEIEVTVQPAPLLQFPGWAAREVLDQPDTLRGD